MAMPTMSGSNRWPTSLRRWETTRSAAAAAGTTPLARPRGRAGSTSARRRRPAPSAPRHRRAPPASGPTTRAPFATRSLRVERSTTFVGDPQHGQLRSVSRLGWAEAMSRGRWPRRMQSAVTPSVLMAPTTCRANHSRWCGDGGRAQHLLHHPGGSAERGGDETSSPSRRLPCRRLCPTPAGPIPHLRHAVAQRRYAGSARAGTRRTHPGRMAQDLCQNIRQRTRGHGAQVVGGGSHDRYESRIRGANSSPSAIAQI